jgi:hypothetical protein
MSNVPLSCKAGCHLAVRRHTTCGFWQRPNSRSVPCIEAIGWHAVAHDHVRDIICMVPMRHKQSHRSACETSLRASLALQEISFHDCFMNETE